jgi:hypothetical protein
MEKKGGFVEGKLEIWEGEMLLGGRDIGSSFEWCRMCHFTRCLPLSLLILFLLRDFFKIDGADGSLSTFLHISPASIHFIRMQYFCSVSGEPHITKPKTTSISAIIYPLWTPNPTPLHHHGVTAKTNPFFSRTHALQCIQFCARFASRAHH